MNHALKLALAAAVAFAWIACASSAPQACAAEAGNKPNIVLIVADDLGTGEIACGGKQPIPTPNIHSIARAGVCFASGYVSCPVCSPTRAGIMTGRYQQRFGHEFNPGPAARTPDDVGLPLDEVTLADRLKKLGYATGMVGKWHLGYAPKFHPQKRGFDEFFGFLGGAHSYVDATGDGANRILRGTEPVDEKAYLTEAWAREATAFIDRHKAKPFFLYVPFNAVHAPIEAPQKYQDRFSDLDNPKRRTFAGMLSALDDAVGKILEALRENQLDENTLVIFIGDNGGPTRQTTSGNAKLHGFKGEVWEGGIRVPFMMQWTGHLPAGKVYAEPVIGLDIAPTAVAAAGGRVSDGKPLDGVNLLPYLTGEKSGPPHQTLFWRFGPQWAVRKGNLKLLQSREAGVQLFDLAADPGEEQDLAGEKPDVVAELKKTYGDWNSQLQEPRWQPIRGGGKNKNKNKQAKAAA